METIWFCIIAVMIAVYVVLDGFDLGAGIIHLLVARTHGERRTVLRTIGPVWDGNEVWLLAAGGTIFFAFPVLYASSFSGFYLPLMIVLWLLILRGISIEFRNHVHSLVWDPLWDFLFCASSLLLAFFFGAALGNVVRGVPLDKSGYFFEPLWTNFRVGAKTGILDWYTILVGLLALAALVLHGAAIGELVLTGQEWFFFLIVVVSVLIAMTRIWMPILFDAFELAGRPRQLPKWAGEGGARGWAITVGAGLAVFVVAVVIALVLRKRKPSLDLTAHENVSIDTRMAGYAGVPLHENGDVAEPVVGPDVTEPEPSEQLSE